MAIQTLNNGESMGVMRSKINSNFIELNNNINNSVDSLNEKSIVRDLNILLSLSLGTSNIDAWADLLIDNSKINASLSENYFITGGKLFNGSYVANTQYNNFMNLGYNTSSLNAAQTFNASGRSIDKIRLMLSKYGSPGDTVKAYIYNISSGNPNAEIYACINEIPASSISTSPAVFEFTFSGVNLVIGTTYAIVLRRTSSSSTSHYYNVHHQQSDVYTFGEGKYSNSSNVWTNISGDLYFEIFYNGQNNVVWNMLTPSTALKFVSVAAIYSGIVTFYVSEDATNWIQITTLNKGQLVSFAQNKLYLKAVIATTSPSNYLDSVAWGGY